MKRLIIWFSILLFIGLAAWAASTPAMEYIKDRRRVTYREVEISRGEVVAVVNSTGTVKPVRSISVGAIVSGPIDNVFVLHNDEVKKGQLLAKVDPKLYKAAVERDDGMLKTRQIEVVRARHQLQQAKNDEQRAKALWEQNKTYISETEMDKFKFDRMVLEAQLVAAERSVDVAVATLENSLVQLAYTDIVAPEDGVLIDCKIEPGQTVQSAFNTPDLFVLAPDMRKKMLVFASVDESDIGRIYNAQKAKQPVHFTVDAYPDQLFIGEIYQIRKSSTTTQNVVTYPVVVAAENPDLKLFPGMTASLSFQVQANTGILRVPNAAIRFFPQREQVHPDDRLILENKGPTPGEVDEQADKARSAAEKTLLRAKRHERYVWVADGEFLRAVKIFTGLSDSTYTEIIKGDLREGQKVVTGVQSK